MLRIVNFISGDGSTNLAILQAENSGGKLHGLVKTLAIISDNLKTLNIQKIRDEGVSTSDVWTVNPEKEDFTNQILEILDKYKPDYFHQVGWMPLTPLEVIKRYRGLNQHLGPGGKWMYGKRRIYAHIRFCEMIRETRPIPIFCQRVAPKYDEGNVIYVQYEDILSNETVEEVAKRLLKIEYQVQIEALYRLATNSFEERPVPKTALNPEEERILLKAKKEALNKYPLKSKIG